MTRLAVARWRESSSSPIAGARSSRRAFKLILFFRAINFIRRSRWVAGRPLCWISWASLFSASKSEVCTIRSSKSLRVTVAQAQIIETQNADRLPSGTLDENLNVVCGKNALKIIKIKPDGSALMGFKDFVNGRHTRPGDVFVRIDAE